ncbi:MAG: DNA-directed RNA polymerase subunit alpha [Parcubacteria group bacterium]|nr:DNA-directed RNA polymerase subunit alpha [Parcubacteria group bacterium]
MIPLSQPVKTIQEVENKGVFEIEALYPGYGVSIGNTLRRVLLSSLQGAAITQVKIKGVAHEFSTIPGVAEDVVTIILHLKQVRFRMFSDEPQTVTLKVKGEKKVKAQDIKTSSEVQVINKDMVIANLQGKQAELDMELRIERGIGYVPVEARKGEKQEIGAIALDAAFSPVRRVSFRVEAMRVGERTDFDRLTLEIETDGALSPQAALAQAIETLQAQFQRIGEGISLEKALPSEGKEKKKSKAKPRKAATPKSKKK